MSTYHQKFVHAVKMSPDVDEVHVQGFIKSARASAGGAARAEKRKQMMCDHSYGEDGMCTKCGAKRPMMMSEFFSQEAQHRLFIELGEDGLTDWKQITPGVGKYQSPRYGSVVITEETLNNFVENFNNRVYQEHIPVDAEHKTKLSGALAYYREMKIGHEGKPGVWARLELTDRGKELLDGGGFKYFSPEFYPEWDDPATGQSYKDVITGGAFTTRPFFKDKAMQPVMMGELEPESAGSELNIADFIDDMVATGASDESIANAFDAALNFVRAMEVAEKSNSGESFEKSASTTMSEDAEVTKPEESTTSQEPNPTQASEDMLRQLGEEREKREALESQVKTFSEQNTQLTERIASMESENRRRAFTEIVTGRGGANDGGPQWFGEPDAHVAMLEKLTKAFGEESDEVKAYIDNQNTVAKAMSEAVASGSKGKAGIDANASGAETRMEGLIKAKMSESNMKYHEAAAAVAHDEPELYTEYMREFERGKPAGKHAE